ncbi:hypothetical protein [Bdellovibrio bacteriovorus]|uniref:hypothetical protein n=1 Tax=Bdellovibrio bacteriovorus TaxID=959 RepID=UPI0035A848C2
MKSLIVALMLIAGPAMAQIELDEAVSSRPDDYQVDILSWCEDNKVMGQNYSTGAVELRADCSTQGLTCKTYNIFRMNRSIYTAACVQQ